MNEIRMIPIAQLEAHPDNPRRELGDLAELAASIRKSGIMQNLTVVRSPAFPDREVWRIIIGHRRFAAAKIAGLTELPCRIEVMDVPTQIATMMAENMQRNDLTISDQVYGVQVMMDLGESCKAISERTGLSETTVHRRLKLTKLDYGKLVQAEKNGATLMDFVRISKYEDPEDRDRLMDVVGTGNFENEILKIKQRQNAVKYRAEAVKRVGEWAERAESRKAYEGEHGCEISRIRSIYVTSKPTDWEMTKPGGAFYTGKTYVFTEETNSIEIFYIKDGADAQGETDYQRRKRIRTGLRDAEREIADRAKALRDNFVNAYNPRREDAGEIINFALWVMFHNGYIATGQAEVFRTFWLGKGGGGKNLDETDRAVILEDPLRALLIGAWCRLEAFGASETTDVNHCMTYDGEYFDNPNMKTIYFFLINLGYRMSDEEKEWLYGTHKCYTRKEE